MSERHTSDWRGASDYHDDWGAGADYDTDRDYGSHAAARARDKARGTPVEVLNRRLNPMHPFGLGYGGPTRCSLCTDDRKCSFHTPDPTLAVPGGMPGIDIRPTT